MLLNQTDDFFLMVGENVAFLTLKINSNSFNCMVEMECEILYASK